MFLTAGNFLVGPILTVLFPVTQLHLGDTARSAGRAAAGTQELVVRAGDGRAVGLVRAIGAVMVAVAVERGRDAQGVGAAELPDVAWREVWNMKQNI